MIATCYNWDMTSDEIVTTFADTLFASQTMEERIEARITTLLGLKRWLTESERQELVQLTYDGPTPRRLPPTDETPL